MKNIKTNALANFLVRFANVVVPVLTGTYINRVFQNSVEYNYFNAGDTLMNIFLPFASLGVYYFGVRQISKVKHDRDQVNYFFSSLFYITVISSILTTLFYVGYVYATVHQKSQLAIYLVLGSQILSSFLYIEWMVEAFENYRFILIKTIILRIIMIVALFGFVRTAEDIIIYAMVMSGAQILNYLFGFVWIKRQVKLVKVKVKDMLSMILPLISLLLMSSAVTLYTALDKLFLSYTDSEDAVSLYSQGQKISTMIATLISSPISVSIPRLGYYLGQNNREAYDNLVYKGARLFAFLIAPISLGLFITGNYAVLLYGGGAYMGAATVTAIFGIRSITWSIETLLANQIIFIHGYERSLTLYYFACGLLNLAFKFLLLNMHFSSPEIYILTTWLSEGVLIALEIYFIKRHGLIKLKPVIGSFLRYGLIAAGFIPISIVVNALSPVRMTHLNLAVLVNLAILMTLCGIYYLAALWLLKDPVLTGMVEAVGNKLRRRG